MPRTTTKTATATSEPPCDNHPDMASVWSSDGIAHEVIHLCRNCRLVYDATRAKIRR